MKQITTGMKYKSLLTFFMIAIFQTIIWAQDNGGSGSSGSTTTSTKSMSVTSDSGNWYASPWLWAAGAVALILLLIALMRGGRDTTAASRTDRVTVTKTSSTDDV